MGMYTEFSRWPPFSKWLPQCQQIEIALISMKMRIHGKHGVKSSSVTPKITFEPPFSKRFATICQNFEMLRIKCKLFSRVILG
jgi:hypothetical protein